MTTLYLVLLCLIIHGIITNWKGKGNGYDYLSKDNCNAIKGVFIFLVFTRHIYPYLTDSGFIPSTKSDHLFEIINTNIGQLLVVMFLFYSGYGVMESIKKKGDNYLKTFPYRRIFITWANFAVAISCFLALDILLGIPFTIKQIFRSLLCWDSMGNSNWYFFIILLLYAITYLTYRIPFIKKSCPMVAIFAFSIILMMALSYLKPFWWYDTMLSYAAGMLFSLKKTTIEYYLTKRYSITLISIFALFIFIHYLKLPSLWGFSYNFESVLFASLVICLSYKINIGNKALCWLGANLFPLYIYQRLPMIALKELAGKELLAVHPFNYILLCAVITLLIAYCYKYWRLQPR